MTIIVLLSCMLAAAIAGTVVGIFEI